MNENWALKKHTRVS